MRFGGSTCSMRRGVFQIGIVHRLADPFGVRPGPGLLAGPVPGVDRARVCSAVPDEQGTARNKGWFQGPQYTSV